MASFKDLSVVHRWPPSIFAEAPRVAGKRAVGVFGAQPWARPRPGVALPRTRYASADALLASCPTDAEQNAIRADFNIAFSRDAAAPWSCTAGGSESSVMLTTYNAFRLLGALPFDAPLPLINTADVYGWLRGLGLTWYMRYPTHDDPLSHAGGVDVVLNADVLAQPWMRRFVDPQSGVGISGLLALMLHEARHTDPGGARFHTCTTPGKVGLDDPSLAYGGAWALEYYFWLWCAQHTGGFLGPLERRYCEGAADVLRGVGGRFCDEDHVAIRR